MAGQESPAHNSGKQGDTKAQMNVGMEQPGTALEGLVLPSGKEDAAVQVNIEPLRDVDEHLNDDDRNKWDWESRWNGDAISHIRMDAFYVGTVFLLTLIVLVLTWRGTIFGWVSFGCVSCTRSRFDQFAYFFLGGMLGGTLFGIKYLYKVVARGRWNIDRRLWRIFSPFMSGGLALAVGTLIDSGILGLAVKSPTASSYLSLGFISGYFADNALAKMQEIAETIFGTPEQRKPASQAQLQKQAARTRK